MQWGSVCDVRYSSSIGFLQKCGRRENSERNGQKILDLDGPDEFERVDDFYQSNS